MLKVGDKVKLKPNALSDVVEMKHVDVAYDKVYTVTCTYDNGEYVRIDGSSVAWFGNRFELASAAHVEDDEYFRKAARWFKHAYQAVSDAGGHAPTVLNNLPEDFVADLIRNEIMLMYLPKKNSENSS